MKDTDNCSSTSHLLPVFDDLIVCEILSRLPVKSLTRFKCVRKSWQSLIEKDEHFRDLHHKLSETRPSILLRTRNYKTRKSCFLSSELLLPSDDGMEGGGATFQRKIPQVDTHAYLLDFVHGLVCYANLDTRSVRIYNPSTRESTPWIKSLVNRQEEDEDGGLFPKRDNTGWSYFGYNPATKEHKVLSLWMVGCEVLTVGGGGKHQNSFRKVDDVLPVKPCYLDKKSVYVNGCIYLYHWKADMDVGLAIIEFNCGTEKFRVISIPDSITDMSRFGNAPLLEVGGRLALLAKKAGEYSTSEVKEYWENNNDTSMKMYLLHHDNNDNLEKKTMQEATNQSSRDDFHWVEETFLLPPFEWKPDNQDAILPIPGTDFFVVRAATIKDDFSFYYYNWKMKKFSRNKVEIDGISPYLVPPDGDPLYHHAFQYYTSTETLVPVT